MQNSRNIPAHWDLLLSAAQKNLPDKITNLIQSEGVDPSHANAVGQSALHIAALWGNTESVQVLIQLGANVNATNNLTGATPLHMAIQSFKVKSFDQRFSVIRLLLQNGADLYLADQYENSPKALLEASFDNFSHDEVKQLQTFLIEHNLTRRPEIFDGIYKRDPEFVQNTLKSDETSVNLIFEGKTPVLCVTLEFACYVDSIVENRKDPAEVLNLVEELKVLESILQILLTSGGNPEIEPVQRNKIDQAKILKPLDNLVSSLRKVCSQETNSELDECYEILRRSILSLLHLGNAQITSDTRLLLYQAARWNELKFLQFLVEELNIDPNTEGPQMMTPLHFAARSGRMDALRYLLQQPGIILNGKDSRGQTPLDAARSNDKVEAIAVLENSLLAAKQD